jgi:hypothetical protein
VLVDTASKVPRRGAARGAAEEKAERPRPDSDGTIIAVVALVDRSIRLVVSVRAGVFVVSCKVIYRLLWAAVRQPSWSFS